VYGLKVQGVLALVERGALRAAVGSALARPVQNV
jgi:hypothetical protein